MRMIWKSCSVASVFLGLEQFVYAWAVMILPSRSHMMMSRWDLLGLLLLGGAGKGNQFYGALIPMFLAHDHHDEKDPYLVAQDDFSPNCVLNDTQ